MDTPPLPKTISRHEAAIIARKRLEALVTAKAWEDDNFRDLLFRDPAEALRRTGVVLPEGFGIEVVEEAEKTFDLSVPEKPVCQDHDLSESETAEFFQSLQDPAQFGPSLNRYFDLYR